MADYFFRSGKFRVSPPVFLAFLFAFRAPCVALLPQRAHRGVRSTSPPPKGEGVNCAPCDRRPTGAHCKIDMAKTHARRAHYETPVLCAHNTNRARSLCPICWLWPWARANRRPGDFLFQKINANNVNRYIQKSLGNLNAPASQRYRSHGFRREDAQDLKESGAQWPIVASAGNWKSLSFRLYVDLPDELTASMAKLFIESYTFDSVGAEGTCYRYYGGLVLPKAGWPGGYALGDPWVFRLSMSSSAF